MEFLESTNQKEEEEGGRLKWRMKLKKWTLFILATMWPTKGLDPKVKQSVGIWTLS